MFFIKLKFAFYLMQNYTDGKHPFYHNPILIIFKLL